MKRKKPLNKQKITWIVQYICLFMVSSIVVNYLFDLPQKWWVSLGVALGSGIPSYWWDKWEWAECSKRALVKWLVAIVALFGIGFLLSRIVGYPLKWWLSLLLIVFALAGLIVWEWHDEKKEEERVRN